MTSYISQRLRTLRDLIRFKGPIQSLNQAPNVNEAAPAIRPPVPAYKLPPLTVKIVPVDALELESRVMQQLLKQTLWHINNDRTAAVSDVQSWLPIDSETPKGVKIQLLTSGGVATYGHYHGEKFWKGWAPLPKIDKRPTSPGENDGNKKETAG